MQGPTMDRRLLLASGALAGLAGLTGCGSRPIGRRYEMEVSLSDAGRRLASSVVQRFVFQEDKGGIVEPTTALYGPEGRTATIRLSSGGVVATLFRGLGESGSSRQPFFDGQHLERDSWIPLEPLARVFLPEAGRNLDRFSRWRSVLDLPPSSAWVDLLYSEMPLLVRFRDPTDGSSVEWVDPENSGSLNPIRIRIRLTEEPITRTPLGRDLPWMLETEPSRALLLGNQANPKRLAELLYLSDFKRG
jgi:hypothetical protein